MKKYRTFKTVIAYENYSSAVYAKEMCDRLVGPMKSEVDAWSFESLTLEWVRDDAIATAAAADMIVFAARSAAELPDPAKVWIESALIQNNRGPVALVAVLGDNWTTSDEPPPLCAYLQRIADRGDVDFFCNASAGGYGRVSEHGYQLPTPGAAVRM